jgi:NAD(P)-dependent dehydrogenase (short-subunit alcohol dehydrogenase family)
MSTWLITGCSTGLGRAFAEEALARGHDVVVTARDASAVQDIADAHPDHAMATALDVTDPDQVTAAVRLATERFGGVDVLVNNAGYGYRSAVEEGDDADVARLFDTHSTAASAPSRPSCPACVPAAAARSSTCRRSAPAARAPARATTAPSRPRSSR